LALYLYQLWYESNTDQDQSHFKAIDQQLKMILKKDIRKIDNVNVRNAAFLQMIAA